MSPSYSDFLTYWRNSLADGSRLSPSDAVIRDGLTLSSEEIERGRVNQATAEQLVAAHTESSDKKPNAIPVLVLPLVFVRPFEHGVRARRDTAHVAPVIISATLSRTGELLRDADTKLPVLCRDLLEPTPKSVAIGSVEAADRFYAANSTDLVSWSATWEFARRMIEAVSGQREDRLSIPGWEREPSGRLLLVKDSPEATHLLRLYDWLKRTGKSELIEHMLAGAEGAELLSGSAELDAAKRHLGHISASRALAPSQRQALEHLLRDYDESEAITVVNGPPGTGKTTLVQSIVASLWVNAAINNDACPLVVAASTSNQAVTNVLKAFEQASSDPQDPLEGRWLTRVTSFGMYLPSARAFQRQLANGSAVTQVYTEMPSRDAAAQHFASCYETPEGLDSGAREFLAKYNASGLSDGQCTSVDDARERLHEVLKTKSMELGTILSVAHELRDLSGGPISLASFRAHRDECEREIKRASAHLAATRSSLEQLRNVLLRWEAYKAGDPWWMLVFGFVPAMKRARDARDRAFFTANRESASKLGLSGGEGRAAIDYILVDHQSLGRRALDEAQATLEKLESRFTLYCARLERFEKWCFANGSTGEKHTFTEALDTRTRHKLFQLATHYWEATYLTEVRQLLDEESGYVDGRTPQKLERQYRRLAMLAPCFISTLHMLPKWFRGYVTEEAYLVNSIDLLIIDEAGQVSPEVAAPVLALAKRACIMGDVHQIEPVWSVPEALDQRNAKRYLKAIEMEDYEALAATGVLAANGSILACAQRASRYSTHPDVAPGFFLTEHRRCLPEIIAYSNELVYEGLLEPCRPTTTFAHKLPPFGWMHVDGRSASRGGSRVNDLEAERIADWVGAHAEALRDTYDKPLGETLAIVTPFTAQAQRINRALRDRGLGHEKLTVGTLHALQGAERNVIVFSPTYGTNHDGENFFSRAPRMLNVAVSRAKDAFLVIGNMDLFRHGRRPSELLGSYLFRESSNELPPLDGSVPPYIGERLEGLHIRDLTTHRKALRYVLTSAKKRAVIASPFLSVNALEADNVPELVRAAVARGVLVLVITDFALNRDEKNFERCVRMLEGAGARVSVTARRGIHCKILCRDEDVFVSGSFNWLAAVRSESAHQRYEFSVIQKAEAARTSIRAFLRDMREHVVVQQARALKAGNE